MSQVPPIAKFTGVVACPYCPWAAEMKSDSSTEVQDFLRGIAQWHQREAHPERPLREILFQEAP